MIDLRLLENNISDFFKQNATSPCSYMYSSGLPVFVRSEMPNPNNTFIYDRPILALPRKMQGTTPVVPPFIILNFIAINRISDFNANFCLLLIIFNRYLLVFSTAIRFFYCTAFSPSPSVTSLFSILTNSIPVLTAISAVCRIFSQRIKNLLAFWASLA